MTVREAVLMMSGGGVADLSPDSDRTTTVRASIGTEEEINMRDRAQGHREGGEEGGGELGEAGEVGEERGGGGRGGGGGGGRGGGGGEERRVRHWHDGTESRRVVVVVAASRLQSNGAGEQTNQN